MHEVLVNRIGDLSLPSKKNVVRLAYRPDMTIDVYRGCKTTIQQQQQKQPSHLKSLCNQLLLKFLSSHFETLHTCYKPIEDVHVTFCR